MSHWVHRLPDLTLEQLDELIAEIGPVAPLTREYNAKALMAQLPGLKRQHAILLVTASADKTDPGDFHSKLLKQLLLQHEFTSKQVLNLTQFMGEFGLKVYGRAVRAYDNDSVQKGLNDVISEILLKIQQDATGEAGIDGEEVSDAFDEQAQQIAPDLKLREYLRDEWDIESAEDFEMMIQAMMIIAKESPNEWIQSGRSTQDQQTIRARRLYQDSKMYPCSPKALWEWRRSEDRDRSPNAIFKRPDGVEIWGNGDRVIYDADGNARRPMQTIFGKEVPDGSVPMDFEMRDMVKRAYPDFYRR